MVTSFLRIFMNSFTRTSFLFPKLRICSYEFVRVFSMLCCERPVLYISRVVMYNNYYQYSASLSTVLISATLLAPIPLPLCMIHTAHLSSSAIMVLYRQPLCNSFIHPPTLTLCNFYPVLFSHVLYLVIRYCLRLFNVICNCLNLYSCSK